MSDSKTKAWAGVYEADLTDIAGPERIILASYVTDDFYHSQIIKTKVKTAEGLFLPLCLSFSCPVLSSSPLLLLSGWAFMVNNDAYHLTMPCVKHLDKVETWVFGVLQHLTLELKVYTYGPHALLR